MISGDKKNIYLHYEDALYRLKSCIASSPYQDATSWRAELGGSTNPTTVPCIKIYLDETGMHCGTILLDANAQPVAFTSHLVFLVPKKLDAVPGDWKLGIVHNYNVCLWYTERPPVEISGWQKLYGWQYE